MMALVTALVVAAAYLVSFTSSENLTDVCSALSDPSCHCTHPSSSAAFTKVRCTFNTSRTPSPLFSNASFASTVTLDTLDLSGNDLDRLPDDFFHLETIHTLILRDNAFVDVPAALKKVKAVTTLDLSFNGLRSLSWEVVAGVDSLERLDVSSNRLTALAGDPEGRQVAKLWHLKELSLASNAVSSINASALGFLTSLTSLDLAHNQLSQVTRTTFRSFGMTLHSLNLSNNSLSDVDPLAFQPLQEIRELRLAHNDLGKALGKLWFPQHVTSLDLRDCGLTSINRCRLSTLADLAVMDLRGNPLNCSCELFSLQQQFQTPDSNQSHWTCQGHPWSSAEGSDDDSSSLSSPSSFSPSTPSSQSVGSVSGNSTETVVADLSGQCQSFYVVCPSVLEMVKQMVTAVDVDANDDTLVVSWTLAVSDDLRIDGFQLRYIPETGDPLTSDLLTSDRRRVVLETSGLAEHFMVCLDVLMFPSAVVHQECQSFQEGTGSSVLVGILAGTVFLLPCAVILVYIFIKDSRIHKALYQKIDLFEDVEKERPGGVVVAIRGGATDRVRQQDKKSDLPISRTSAAPTSTTVVTVESTATTEPDDPRTQDSEAITGKTPPATEQATVPVKAVLSVHQPTSQSPAKTEGIGNQGFRCEGGHQSNVACPDPQHVSVKL